MSFFANVFLCFLKCLTYEYNLPNPLDSGNDNSAGPA
jgi:hypothetical protein